MAAADFNVSKFKGALAGGGARPSLFEFNITGLPTDIDIGNINYFCQVSALPPLTVTPIEKTYFGRAVKIPGDIVFGDLSTTIYQTESGDERAGIEKWMDAINGHVTNKSTLGQGYYAKGTLTQYSKAGGSLSTVDFIDMWPQTVSEIALSYDTASDIEQFDVTWSYNYYSVKIGATTYN
jgi:hypothetical protein